MIWKIPDYPIVKFFPLVKVRINSLSKKMGWSITLACQA
jgi:hypothetical protein